MARQRTGTVWYIQPKNGEEHGHYAARVTCLDGSRPVFHLPPSPESPAAEKKARAEAQKLAERVHRERLVLVPSTTKGKRQGDLESAEETLSDYAERWLAEREGRGLTSAKDDRGRLSKWVLPRLGDKTIQAIERRDLEELVSNLDDRVRGGELSWLTARKTWAIVSKLFKDASRSKRLELRVRTDNPAIEVEGPDKGTSRSKTYLYPTEFLQLVRCPHVPMRWRRLYAVGTYTFLRTGELEALEWEDVDLDRRIIHVHRSINRAAGGTKATKTDSPRRIPIHENLLPLLEAMRCEGPDRKHVLDMPPAGDLPKRTRTYLKKAGIKRTELFITDATRKQIRFYDATRATGITWCALDGLEPQKIQQRAGHTNFTTTQGYIREAENLVYDVGQPFPELPPELSQSSWLTIEGPAYWAQLRGKKEQSLASPAGFEPA